jgi:predicted metallopeptidase
MKLEKILDNLGSLEKNSFIKIIDNIIANNPKNFKEIDKILSTSDKGLKSVDSQNIAKIFNLIEKEFSETVKEEFVDTSSQLDILIDIITRDGNNIMKQDWFSRLYEIEVKKIKKKVKELEKSIKSEKSEIEENRIRDYKIYKTCVHTAYFNDELNNRDAKITDDELSILLTLANQLELSQEERKLINYMVIPIKQLDIDDIITNLKNIGVIFYSKKQNTVYVADSIVRILRKLRGKDIADKFLRRILRVLKTPEINLIAKKHNIERKLSTDEKIKEIIKEGIGITTILSTAVHKDGTNLTEKKRFVNELWDKRLKIKQSLKGVTLEDKVSNLIAYFENREKDEKVGISIDGYEKLLIELNETLPKTNKIVKEVFELQDEFVLKSDFLLDYNIKPRDILDIIPQEDLIKFCKARNIKTRGDEIINILDNYKDAENLYLENYENIGFRDINALKENGIVVKESELGIKFEELTKNIFEKLGFNVDESLRKKLNTRKDKIDIIINLGNNELIVVECKTVKESGYNKFSSVSRQLKAYNELAKKNEYDVRKLLLVAPDFSDDFIEDCEMDVELDLSLLTAASLMKIFESFKKSKHKQFPYKLLMRDVLINSDRIVKAISK